MKEKLKGKKGISLIVLVITIVVIIILAAAVILTLSNNNPVEKADEAVNANDVTVLKERYTLAYSDYVLYNENTKIDEKVKKEIMQSVLEEKYKETLNSGEIVYTGNNESIKDEVNKYEVLAVEKEKITFVNNIKRDTLIYNRGYITGLEMEGNTVESVLANFENSSLYTIYDVKETKLTGTTEVTTGYTIRDTTGTITYATLVVFGDINLDGRVNEIDAGDLLNFLVNIKNDSFMYIAADVNHDGMVSKADADFILDFCVELKEIDQNKLIKILY